MNAKTVLRALTTIQTEIASQADVLTEDEHGIIDVALDGIQAVLNEATRRRMRNLLPDLEDDQVLVLDDHPHSPR
jgi:hypothetical protein